LERLLGSRLWLSPWLRLSPWLGLLGRLALANLLGYLFCGITANKRPCNGSPIVAGLHSRNADVIASGSSHKGAHPSIYIILGE